MLEAAFYIPTDPSTLLATSATGGPWSPDLQHGGPPAALLATLMARHVPAEMQMARLLVDFLGPMPVETLEVSASLVRPGKRVALAEARMSAGGREVCKAQAWFTAPGSVDAPPTGPAPPPLPDPQPQVFFPGLPVANYAAAMEWRFLHGSFAEIGPAAVWARPRIPVIDGEPLTALQGLLLLADSANGISAELSYKQWIFMPVSLHLAFLRPPAGEWTLLQAQTTLGPTGIGVTQGTLSDATGQVAVCTQSLYVAPRG